VLVAPDKFKGSLSAVDVASAVRLGVAAHASDAHVVCVPVADGGDGTLDAAVAAGFERIAVTATGPTGEPVQTAYAVRDGTAVVELADVSGLVRLPQGTLAPLTATSRGVGEVVANALDHGVARIVLGIGGSACTDGGAGLLQALGASLRDRDGAELPPGGGPLGELAEIDLAGLDSRLTGVELVVACDVDNPLTGRSGAAAVYGPQKGATPREVGVLDANLARLADCMVRHTGADHRDHPGAGAAGGVGFAAVAALGATLRPGIDLMLEMLSFDELVQGTDLVVVGEGSLDAQTLHGKAPLGVARLARAAGVKVVAVCGRRSLSDDELRGAGIAVAYACADLEADPDRCMSEASALLEQLGRRLAHEQIPAQRHASAQQKGAYRGSRTPPHPMAGPDARAFIRASLTGRGRRIAVLDDDPTGSQTVHGVGVVTALDPREYTAALDAPGSTAFVLTNTRSLAQDEAVGLTGTVAEALFRLSESSGLRVDVVSRSDSTLRGHVIAEVRAIDAARRAVTGRGYDGVLLAPGYFEAGRFTADDVHWATVGGQVVPVGESEFARDATFGYGSSNLKDFVAEASGGAVSAADVESISLDDIRIGGPDLVAEILGDVNGGRFVVVNGIDYADYEIVALALQRVEEAGRSFLCRTGPSFVRALAGIEPREPMTRTHIWPGGRPSGHGLVIVGSHVGLTSRQMVVAQQRGGIAEIELHVPALTDPRSRDAHVARIGAQVAQTLATSDVMLFTSRTLVRGGDGDDSLAISRAVSTAVFEVTRAALASRPAWVVAKGGITSHDVAVRGLGIRRAEVLGQLFPGIVSVLRPVEAAPEAVGVPYVVFAGNVGDENTLAGVIETLGGGSHR
jgi:glycerate kinase